MGIGFVLLVWTLLFGCAGLPVAIGLAIWSWKWGRSKGAPSKWRAAGAATLPVVLIAVGLFWFVGYAAYSWKFRHVDPALGDSWMVPIGRNHFFCMIDVTDYGYLMKDGCSGEPLTDHVTELAQSGDVVVGVDPSGAFVLNLNSDEIQRYPTSAEALARVGANAQLRSADAFYRGRRFGWQDLAAVGVLGLGVAFCAWLWFIRLVRPPLPKSA